MSGYFENWNLETWGIMFYTYNEIFISADDMVVHAARASVAVVLPKFFQ